MPVTSTWARSDPFILPSASGPLLLQTNDAAIAPHAQEHVLGIETLMILRTERLRRRSGHRGEIADAFQRIANLGGVRSRTVDRLQKQIHSVVTKRRHHWPTILVAEFLLHFRVECRGLGIVEIESLPHDSAFKTFLADDLEDLQRRQ